MFLSNNWDASRAPGGARGNQWDEGFREPFIVMSGPSWYFQASDAVVAVAVAVVSEGRETEIPEA